MSVWEGVGWFLFGFLGTCICLMAFSAAVAAVTNFMIWIENQ